MNVVYARHSFLFLLVVFLSVTTVAAVCAQPSAEASYALPGVRTAGDPYEPNDTLEEATEIAYAFLLAEIGEHDDVEYFDDVDLYKFMGYTGDEIKVDIIGGDDVAPVLSLLDAEGTLINDASAWPGDEVHFQQMLTAAGDYYLRVEGDCHEGGSGCSGPYSLSLTIIDRYEPNDSIAEAQRLPLEVSLRAAVEEHDEVPFYDDVDFYDIGSTEDVALVVDIVALGDDLDPDCEVMEDEETVLASDYGMGKRCHLEWDYQAPGTVYVKVFALCHEGGLDCQGAYSLTLALQNEPPQAMGDSYEVAAAETLLVAAPGVLFNDADGDGDALTAVLAVAAQHGDLDLMADGSFTYTPAIGFTGNDAFQYEADDGKTRSAAVAVSLVVKKHLIFLPAASGG